MKFEAPKTLNACTALLSVLCKEQWVVGSLLTLCYAEENYLMQEV